MTWPYAWDGGDSVPSSLAHMFLQCSRKLQQPMEATAWGSSGEEKECQEGRVPSKSLFPRRRCPSNQPTLPQWLTVHGQVLPLPLLRRQNILDGKPGCLVGRGAMRSRSGQFFNGAQRGIPKGDDVGPAGTCKLDRGGGTESQPKDKQRAARKD